MFRTYAMYPFHDQAEANESIPTETSPTSTSSQRKRTNGSSPAEANADGRKVHRVSRACDYCKSKKTRCSGTRPCDSCTKRRIVCEYDTQYLRGRPPTPPIGRESLDRARDATTGREGQLRSPLRGSSGARVQPEVSSRSTSIFPTDEVRTSPDLDIAEIEGQYFDTTSGLTFLHRAYKKLSTQEGDIVSHTPSITEKRQPLMTVGDRTFKGSAEDLRLPSRDVTMDLVKFYFDECVVTYRIFHRQTVISWLETLASNVENGAPLTKDLGNAKAAIILGILAVVTFRHEKVQKVRSDSFDETSALAQSDPFFATATSLTNAETGFPVLESAQARLIQVLYLLQTSRMNQGWYIFGITALITSALGLHRRSNRNGNTGKPILQDYIAIQSQRRAFWVAYTIDKYLSVVFGRPRHYRDEDIDQEFPDCVNDEDMTAQGPSPEEPNEDCHVDAVIFHARLSQIIATTSRDVYAIKHIPNQDRIAAAHRAIRELHEWRRGLPPYLGTIRPTTLVPSFRRQATALRLAYSHAIIHANRPFLLGHMSNRPGDSTKDNVHECIAAAKVILETVEGMAGEGTLFHAFWWTPYVTFCALAVVYVREIQRNTSGEEMRDSSWAGLVDLADSCLSHLAKSTTPNSPNRRYSVILEELRIEARRQPRRATDAGLEPQAGEDPRGMATDGTITELQESFYGQDQLNGTLSAPAGDAAFGMNNLLDGWQTSDWLDLDSSAFVPYVDFGGSPSSWIPDVG